MSARMNGFVMNEWKMKKMNCGEHKTKIILNNNNLYYSASSFFFLCNNLGIYVKAQRLLFKLLGSHWHFNIIKSTTKI